MAFDGEHHIAHCHGVAIVLQKAYFQGAIDHLEHSLSHFGAAEHTGLLGHHLGLADGIGRNACQRRVVAIANILAQGHSNQFVEIVNLHHNRMVLWLILKFPPPLSGVIETAKIPISAQLHKNKI